MGRGYGPRRGGWAERSWSCCVYISARVTSVEKRTELTRLIPRGGQGGGPAPEEARPGRVWKGGRLRPAPGLAGELGAGPGRLRPLEVSWRAGDQFPTPSGFISTSYLSFPPLLSLHGRLYSVILLFSLFGPLLPLPPSLLGVARLGSDRNLFLQENKNRLYNTLVQ